MKKSLLVKLLLILAIVGVSLYVSFFDSRFKFSLGLDLAGGSRLVFEADTSRVDLSIKDKALESLRTVIEKRVNLFGVSESNVYSSNFENKDRIIVELPGITDPKEATLLIGKTAQLVFAIPNSESEATASSEIVGLIPTNLTGADLKSAETIFDQNTGKPAVAIEFNDEGSKKFETITGENIGKPLAILLDNEIVSSPLVNEKITGGKAQISGQFTLEEAEKLETQLNAGALPVPVLLVEEKTVGASLGVDSINKSLKAGIIGLIMISIFMILIYGRYGIVSVISLLIFAIITIAIYKIIPITLTLPGIAGFLLTVGMAVDSNILIFERLKEEIKLKSLETAMEVSFGKAWDSIRDANIATLVAAFILANPLDWGFLHISGPVRGFAITLALGIGISLFTGIVVSRSLLRLFIRNDK